MSLDGGYVVARANATAHPFVARSGRVREGWIIVSRHGTYQAAMLALAELLR